MSLRKFIPFPLRNLSLVIYSRKYFPPYLYFETSGNGSVLKGQTNVVISIPIYHISECECFMHCIYLSLTAMESSQGHMGHRDQDGNKVGEMSLFSLK